MSRRLTKREWQAIADALAHLLAGSWDEEGNDASYEDTVSAQAKVWERLAPSDGSGS